MSEYYAKQQSNARTMESGNAMNPMGSDAMFQMIPRNNMNQMNQMNQMGQDYFGLSQQRPFGMQQFQNFYNPYQPKDSELVKIFDNPKANQFIIPNSVVQSPYSRTALFGMTALSFKSKNGERMLRIGEVIIPESMILGEETVVIDADSKPMVRKSKSKENDDVDETSDLETKSKSKKSNKSKKVKKNPYEGTDAILEKLSEDNKFTKESFEEKYNFWPQEGNFTLIFIKNYKQATISIQILPFGINQLLMIMVMDLPKMKLLLIENN